MKDAKPNPNRDKARELARKIGGMTDEQRQAFAAQAPIATIDGRIVSLKNMMLATMQRADATVIGGFRQWIAAGRCVRQGEQALYIWIPSTRHAASVDPLQSAADNSDVQTSFFLAPVFDVSQTVEIAEQAAAA